MLQMIDDETGLRMTMAVQSKPRNPRLADNNLFRIVTWTKGLGDPHPFHDRVEFHSRIPTRQYLIYRLRLNTDQTGRSSLSAMQGDMAPTAGYAFADYDLLRLEFDEPGDIGPEEVQRAFELLQVELLTYEEYLTGQVYSFTISDRAGTALETQANIYGADYAEHLAKEAFDNHRMGIGADNR
ncbi:hypothetical protein [Palleronia aestuarii]|nr:hypothetical protein [Palleronia aestuarii]